MMVHNRFLTWLVLLAFSLTVSCKKKTDDENVIHVSGNIEITDAALSFKIAGRVTERLASEGDIVKKGVPIARLDREDLEQEVSLRKAEKDAAQASLQELEAGSRKEEIDQARAALNRARAEETRWKQEYERQQTLHQKEVISDRELESTRMSFEVSQSKVREAEESYRLLEKGPRIEKIEQARAQLRRAEEALGIAETRLGYAELISPINGVVLSENVEAGEYVSAGTPILTVGELNSVWLRAYINETDLGRVHLGQKVNVRTDSYPGKSYDGKISFISSESEFTPKTVQTEKERVKLVYRIKIDIANPHSELKPGMPADAQIVTASQTR